MEKELSGEGASSADYDEWSMKMPDRVVEDALNGVEEAQDYLDYSIRVIENSGAYSDEQKADFRRRVDEFLKNKK